MEQQLKMLTEIAEYAKQTYHVKQLTELRRMLENGTFLLAVMGEFSAGKSRLINNLIGKQVLPVRITETTAVVTYLQYAETEYAELVYQDQSVKQCSVEESTQLWQSKENETVLSQLLCIRLYINSPLLQNGLRIADTPGVNTVLKQHIAQTTQLIESASRVLYVLGKTPTQSDMAFIEKVRQCSIPVMFVRTHWDMLNPAEEDPMLTKQKEQKLLSAYTSDPVFFVSNDEHNEGFKEISSGLIPYISSGIASDAKKVLRSAVESRAKVIALQLQDVLQQTADALQKLRTEDTAAFAQKKKETEEQIKSLQQLFDQKKETLRQRFETVKQDAKRALPSIVEHSTNNVSKQLESMDFNKPDAEAYAADFLKKEAEKGCLRIRQQYLSYYDAFLTEYAQELLKELINVDSAAAQYFNIPSSMLEADKEAVEIDAEIEALLALGESLEEEIQEHQKRVEQAADKKSEAQEKMAGLQESIQAIHAELEQYGPYVPRYKVKRGTHKVEQGMGALGMAADLATLLIPGPTWAIWGMRIIEKLGGPLKAGIKAGKEVKAVKDAANGVDAVADVMRGIHAMHEEAVAAQKEAQINETLTGIYEGDEGYHALQERLAGKPPKLLDYLSLSYYFKKIGRNFDTPDIVVIDEAHQQQYLEGRDRITRQMEAKAQQAADERCKALRIQEEEEKQKILAAEKKKRAKETEREIKELQDRKEQERREAVNRKCREYYADTLLQYYTDFCDTMESDLSPVLEEKFQAYLETADVRLFSELQKRADELKKLEEAHQANDAEAYEAKLETCNTYLRRIGEMTA